MKLPFALPKLSFAIFYDVKTPARHEAFVDPIVEALIKAGHRASVRTAAEAVTAEEDVCLFFHPVFDQTEAMRKLASEKKLVGLLYDMPGWSLVPGSFHLRMLEAAHMRVFWDADHAKLCPVERNALVLSPAKPAAQLVHACRESLADIRLLPDAPYEPLPPEPEADFAPPSAPVPNPSEDSLLSQLAQDRTQVCPPMSYGKSQTVVVPKTMRVSTIKAKGFCFRQKIRTPVRVDVFRAGERVTGGTMDTPCDDVWWLCRLPEAIEIRQGDLVRLTNQDKRPIAFYLSPVSRFIAIRFQ